MVWVHVKHAVLSCHLCICFEHWHGLQSVCKRLLEGMQRPTVALHCRLQKGLQLYTEASGKCNRSGYMLAAQEETLHASKSVMKRSIRMKYEACELQSHR